MKGCDSTGSKGDGGIKWLKCKCKFNDKIQIQN